MSSCSILMDFFLYELHCQTLSLAKNKMNETMSDPKAHSAYEDEERTSSTAMLKSEQPSANQSHRFSSGPTLYNALIIGVCNFLAPGIWGE